MNARGPYRIGVLSDTHGFLNPRIFEIFDGVRLILHCGDIGSDDLLVELETIAPVLAVSGNVDSTPHPQRRPLTRQSVTIAGRIAMTHGHLDRASAFNHDTLVAYFRTFEPDIIFYGHTHVPFLGECRGVILFNPGAAGRVQGGRPPSVGLIAADGQGPARFDHVNLT